MQTIKITHMKLIDCRKPAILLLVVFLISCGEQTKKGNTVVNSKGVYADSEFEQEYHEAYTVGKSNEDNDVRSITVDDGSNIWVATASGVFIKDKGAKEWYPAVGKNDIGPSYSVERDSDGNIWMGTWNGVYRFSGDKTVKVEGVKPPISKICTSKEGIYALGPYGIWFYKNDEWIKKEFSIARSIRDAITDGRGGLWVATDVGVYHCNGNSATLYQDQSKLISCYTSGLSFCRNNNLWVGGLGGVSVLKKGEKIKEFRPEDGIPSVHVNCVSKSPGKDMWVGTDIGVVRYYKDGTHSLRFSRRWLINNKVRDIAFDKNGNAWLATAGGVSAIMKKKITLEEKANYFHDMLMRRHIREPYIVGRIHLPVAGDTSTWEYMDSDNDGLRVAELLVVESLKYAVTKDDEARKNARKGFDMLKMLQEITGTDGFFARTIIPAEWTEMKHPNHHYTEKEAAEMKVNRPRFKNIKERWHLSKDGKWRWKGDTSSDEWCGHMFGYYFYYEYAANEKEKELVREHVSKIVDYVIKHNYNFIDVDGEPTHWGVWSPDKLNRDQNWRPEKGINSLEMLAFLKFTYYITQNEKYQKEYLRLINEEGYLDNIELMHHQNPAWITYIDANLSSRVYPLLLKCETDPKLLKVYEEHMDTWFHSFRKADEFATYNMLYNYCRNNTDELATSIEYLKDMPIQQVPWNIDHTIREDVKIVRKPVLEMLQIEEVPPVSLRARYRTTPSAVSGRFGTGHEERKPVYSWLVPYWLGRYIGAIK
jgi:hypothetical protein